MAGIKINTEMFVLAREARGVSQAELAEKINTTQTNINRWEAGLFDVNKEAFSQISTELNFPESFFSQEGHIMPPTFYRKRNSVPKKVMDVLNANINIYRINLWNFLHANHPVPTIPSYTGYIPAVAAQKLREEWKVADGPITNLTELLEAHGIIIIPFDFGTERVDSRFIYTIYRHPIIFTNEALLGDRLRFSLAYELGHLALNERNFFPPEDPGHLANLFAAEFLMPEKDILEDFKSGVTLQTLATLKIKWKVSMQALLYRADDLGLLTPNQKRYVLGQFNELNIRRREPPEFDIPKEQPKLLRDLITKYRTRQKMSVKDMAASFHLNETDFIERYIST